MRHALVRSLLVHFLERAGYVGPLRLFTRLDGFLRIAKIRGYDCQLEAGKTMGAAMAGRRPTVFINVPLHKSVAEMADTCAHEAIHITNPALRHGRGFDRRVRRLVRGGDL